MTYGVLPLAAIPITVSFGCIFILYKSFFANSSESSAPSTAFKNAASPPAIIPTTLSVPNVG